MVAGVIFFDFLDRTPKGLFRKKRMDRMISARVKLLFTLLIFTLACGLVEPISPPTPTLAPALETSTAIARVATQTEAARVALFTPTLNIPATQTESAAQLATEIAAYTPTPKPSITPSPRPGDLAESENPAPPPAVSPGGNYKLKNEIVIGSYGIRYWHHTDSATGYEDIVLIEKKGMESILIESAFEIVTLIDADINGDGFPDVIIETYSGGAHCCFSTQVYSLGEKPILILKKPESNISGEFEDLDDDGIYEYITADDIFAYEYCPFVSSPIVKVIMAYDEQAGRYLPASPNFPNEYIKEIEENTQSADRVARANINENGEWDDTTKCSVLPLVLDYIYLGDLEKAHSELERVYEYDDLDSFWNRVMLIIQDSPLYMVIE